MPKELDEEENWILAKIICFHDKVREYEVEDIDKMKNEKHGKQFMVSMKNVIELPGPGGYLQEFPRSHRVIALYPNTTCFYKASIIIPPSKQNIRTQYYLISFDNDNDAVRHVDAQYVLDAPNELK
ncbi:6220_t:CDS:2 [Diversispora eburnea]|uniref:6220_t:CDS:1 n=1 Tax=Diversispora eburnea TaxID=1213867 RepID=A0A9N8V3X4_9GLOM|nr:6220_t:CDS:2 [Diversispora eburnea]